MWSRRITRAGEYKIMEFEKIGYEQNEAVVRLSLNRPKAFNAVDQQLVGELFDALLNCERDDSVRAVVLTGTGKAFSAGGDVGAFHKNIDTADTFIRRLAHGLHGAISQITRMGKPVIAEINGVVAGAGMGLALAPDLAIAAESVKFTMAYTGIGASADGSTTYFLPRLIGTRRAKEMSLLNRTLTAAEAVEWGIINKAVPDDELRAEVDKLAARLAAGPTLAYGAVKGLINQSHNTSLETQMEEEARNIGIMGTTDDFREGVTAFVEKRKPEFKGR